jgi:hypothetical protein
MSSNLPRSSPWIDWDEWTTVKNFIYSGDLNNQISALECIALWKVRGKLPHSVESTAQLLEVLALILLLHRIVLQLPSCYVI